MSTPTLKERTLDNSVRFPYLQYESISQFDFISHCFTTRDGGVSKGIFSSLNLSFSRGDDERDVLENYARVAEILGTTKEHIVCSDQTHTTNVRLVTAADMGKGVTRPKDYTDVDGLITNVPGVALATFYADCVPLYFVDPVHRAIGLSHSGWRGTVGRMGEATLKAMKKAFDTKPESVYIAIGPSICQECYEVSLDVAEAFYQEFILPENKDSFVQVPNGINHPILREKDAVAGERKFLLNLWEANKKVMLDGGVLPEHMEITTRCTCCNPTMFFSHRASRGKRGNLGAFMMIKEN